MYNLGFLALGGDVSGFLDWWQERLSWDCVIAPDQGFFVDQRWMDFVPGCFDHVILRDPSYNVVVLERAQSTRPMDRDPI